MADIKKSGYIVQTKDGKVGRTFHEKGLINGKIPVYPCIQFGILNGYPEIKVPQEYSDKAILCDPSTLKQIGLIWQAN